jgi:hypothetical protein
MTVWLIPLCWSLASAVGVVGFHGLFRAEHARQRKVDRAVQVAWDIVERELNPPPKPTGQELRAMSMQQNTLSQAQYQAQYYGMAQNLNNASLGNLSSVYGYGPRPGLLGGLFGL